MTDDLDSKDKKQKNTTSEHPTEVTKEKETQDFPDVLSEIFEDMPQDKKNSISMSLMQTSLRGSGIGHPLFEKFTKEHIDKFLDYTQRDDENDYKLKSSNRWFVLVYTILGISVFLFLIIFLLPRNNELLLDIIKIFIAFVGGLGSGFGLKSLKKE